MPLKKKKKKRKKKEEERTAKQINKNKIKREAAFFFRQVREIKIKT